MGLSEETNLWSFAGTENNDYDVFEKLKSQGLKIFLKDNC